MFKVTLLFTLALSVYANLLLEPSVQCTVIKVYTQTKIFKLKNFPTMFDSIRNDPLNSKLIIAGQEMKKLNVKLVSKTKNFEEVLIQTKGQSLVLNIWGKPISRKGKLKIKNTLIADLTCH